MADAIKFGMKVADRFSEEVGDEIKKGRKQLNDQGIVAQLKGEAHL